MSLTRSFPEKSIIKYKAKRHLLNDPSVGVAMLEFDEDLLNEIAETVFQSDRYPTLNQTHQPGVKQAIESQVAAEVVIHYKRIKVQAMSPIVQQLNALL